MIVWYAGRNIIPTCIPDGHLHRVTYTRCRIDTVNSPDDGHMSARNTYRIEINIQEKFVHQFGLFTKIALDYLSHGINHNESYLQF